MRRGQRTVCPLGTPNIRWLNAGLFNMVSRLRRIYSIPCCAFNAKVLLDLIWESCAENLVI